MSLEQDALHEAVLVHCPPQPVSDAIHRRADLVQKPPGTPPGFPVTQVSCEEGAEFDAPFTKGLVAHLNVALVE